MFDGFPVRVTASNNLHSALCYTVHDMKSEDLEFYEPTIREDIRRLGIIMTAAGLVSGVLEDADPWVAFFLAVSGLLALVLGNLRYKQ